MWIPWTVFIVGVTALLPSVQATVYHQSADKLIRVRWETERRGPVEVRMSRNSTIWYPVCFEVFNTQKIALWLCESQFGLNTSWSNIENSDFLPPETQFAKAVCSKGGKCSFSFATNCTTTRSWIAYCPAPDSPDFSVRLTGGGSERKGLVQTLVNGKWLSICSTLFDMQDANVVCRQLGFTESIVKISKYHTWNATVLSLNCRGNESRLMECPRILFMLSIPCNFTAAVECGLRRDYSPRLAGKSVPFMTTGRLEVYLRENWTPVCDASTIDDNVARVACREMGQGSAYAYAFPWALAYGWDNIRDGENLRFECLGSEKNLSECSREVSQVCEGPVGIVCSHYMSSRVRLVGGDGKVGRLELNIGGIWGAVCSQGFSDREAGVVCRQSRHYSGLNTVWPSEALRRPYPDSVVWPFEFSCNGDEINLERCSRRRVTSGRCTQDKNVAVSCKKIDDNPLRMRLTGGTSTNSGRLEVLVNGLWGTVCGNGFTSSAAKVACRQMGLASAQARVLSHQVWPSATGLIFLNSVRCGGSERSILSCSHRLGANSCTHSQDVAITCGGSTETDTKKSSLSYGELTAIRAIAGAIVPSIMVGVAVYFCIYRSKRQARQRREGIDRRDEHLFGTDSRLRHPYSFEGVFYTNNSNTVQSPFDSTVMAWPQPPSPPENVTAGPPSYGTLFPHGNGNTADKTPPPQSYDSVTPTEVVDRER